MEASLDRWLDRTVGPSAIGKDSLGDRMRCSRCEGLMVPMWMADPVRPDAVQGWRCLLCGEATDPIIEANRKKRPVFVKGRPRLPCSIAGEH